MIEISTTALAIFLFFGAVFVVFSLWMLEKLMTSYIKEINDWRSLAKDFVDSCEIDGFGDAHDVHMGDLTAAVNRYKELNNE